MLAPSIREALRDAVAAFGKTARRPSLATPGSDLPRDRRGARRRCGPAGRGQRHTGLMDERLFA
ncbi:MAG: hypothetical protein R3F08_14920 [Dokdonella sp.]